MAVLRYAQWFGGKNGPNVFDRRKIREIGLRGYDYVDQIRIDGVAFGKGGGTDKGSLILDNDEFICRVDIRSKDYIDFIRFTTNKARVIEAGGTGGKLVTLDGIMLVEIAGHTGTYVDALELVYDK